MATAEDLFKIADRLEDIGLRWIVLARDGREAEPPTVTEKQLRELRLHYRTLVRAAAVLEQRGQAELARNLAEPVEGLVAATERLEEAARRVETAAKVISAIVAIAVVAATAAALAAAPAITTVIALSGAVVGLASEISDAAPEE